VTPKSAFEPLLAYCNDVERALKAGCDYSALALALALPDICVSLEQADGETNHERYADWADHWALPIPSSPGDPGKFISGKQLYDLRCRYLHNGTTDFRKPLQISGPRSQLLFCMLRRKVVDEWDRPMRIRDWEQGWLLMSADALCREIVSGTREWAMSVRTNATVLSNLQTLVDLDFVREPDPADPGPSTET
jgi:hypothetical protein